MRSGDVRGQLESTLHAQTKGYATSWILEAGQGWKLYLMLAGFVWTFLCLMMAVVTAGGEGREVLWLILCGLLLGIATFAWFSAIRRCPYCQRRLVRAMASTRPHSSWLIDFAGLQSYPACNQPFRQRRRGEP